MWIFDCVKMGRLQNKENYFLIENNDPSALKLNIGKKKRYSMIEGVHMYEIMGA